MAAQKRKKASEKASEKLVSVKISGAVTYQGKHWRPGATLEVNETTHNRLRKIGMIDEGEKSSDQPAAADQTKALSKAKAERDEQAEAAKVARDEAEAAKAEALAAKEEAEALRKQLEELTAPPEIPGPGPEVPKETKTTKR